MKQTIVIPEFLTHVEKTDNKVAPNKFVKINNQTIYNGAITRFTRNTVIGNMHKYIEDAVDKHILRQHLSPVKIKFIIKTVLNHGSISRRNGKINWKKVGKNYVPNWDIENLSSIWIKCINDVLVKKRILVDDNVKFIKKISYEFEEVDDISEREIIVEIQDIDE